MKKHFKKALSSILIVSQMLSCLMAIHISAAAALETKNGFLDIEAEKTTYANTNLNVVSDKKFSGGKALAVGVENKEQPDVNAAPDIDLSFKADRAGTYTIWLRSTAAQDGNSGNSIFMSVNGAQYAFTRIPGDRDAALWGSIGKVTIGDAGSLVTVKIKTRQFYHIAFDRFIITDNPDYKPDDAALGIGSSPAAANTTSPSTMPANAGSSIVFNTKNGLAKIEAEDIKINSNFTKITGEDISGGKGINTSVSVSKTPVSADFADIEFSFKADQTGIYKIWLRVKPTTSNKTLAVSINQGDYQKVSLGGEAGKYHWVSIGKTTSINAGDIVSVRIITLNGYFDIDSFLITNKINATPSGVDGTLSNSAAADPILYPTPPALPPAGHPRVYFTSKDIPRLLKNAAKPQNESAWAKHESNLSDSAVDTIKPLSGTAATNFDSGVLGVIESRAFDYVLRGNEAAGKKAITAMRSYMDNVVFAAGDYDNIGQTVFTIGAVYDWCYPLLSGDDKDAFIGAVPNLAAQMEIGWPPAKQGAVTGHGVEGQLQRDLMCAAIAMYDERPDMYLNVAGRLV